MKFGKRLRLALRVLTYRESTIEQWAEKELALAFPPPAGDYNGAVVDAVQEILHIFASQGHTGFSASMAVHLAQSLMKWQPITPLTGEPDEWMEIDAGLSQNLRCPKVFLDVHKGAYVLDAYIFEDENGDRFTGFGSSKPITFPYDVNSDKPIIVKVDHEGTPLLKKWRKLRERNAVREL